MTRWWSQWLEMWTKIGEDVFTSDAIAKRRAANAHALAYSQRRWGRP